MAMIVVGGLFFLRTSIVRPAFAAASRASAIWLLVKGLLDWRSHPPGACFQPCLRSPFSVMKFAGARPLSPPKRCLPTSILWTFVTGCSLTGIRRPFFGTLRSIRKSALGRIVAGSIPRYLSTAGVAT
jgi:hypothetical protein